MSLTVNTSLHGVIS